VLSEVDRGRLFLLGLPKWLRNKVVVRQAVDDVKPETYAQFDKFLAYVVTFNRSNQTTQALEMQKDPTPAYKKEIIELIEERGTPQLIPEALKKVPLLVPAAKASDLA